LHTEILLIRTDRIFSQGSSQLRHGLFSIRLCSTDERIMARLYFFHILF
jgi:hypothetical protein